MPKQKQFSIAYRDAWAVALIVFNVLIVTPTSWFLRTLWDTSSKFMEGTAREIEQLNCEIDKTRTDAAEKYMTKADIQNYRETINQQLISINSALINQKNEN